MGSRTKFVMAGVLTLGVITAAGLGFLVGRESDEPRELTAFQGPPEAPEGDGVVYPEPLPAGDPDAPGNSSGPNWETNEVRINQEQAVSIARTRSENARVLHAELDEEDGYFIWEILLQQADGSQLEMLIDAGDGRILGIDHEGFDD